MSNKNMEKVCAYLDESSDSYSDFSDQDDSDADLDFSLPSTSQNSLSKVGPSHTLTNNESDTSNESFEVSSSDDENVNIPDNNDDQWYENWEDIPDF